MIDRAVGEVQGWKRFLWPARTSLHGLAVWPVVAVCLSAAVVCLSAAAAFEPADVGDESYGSHGNNASTVTAGQEDAGRAAQPAVAQTSDPGNRSDTSDSADLPISADAPDKTDQSDKDDAADTPAVPDKAALDPQEQKKRMEALSRRSQLLETAKDYGGLIEAIQQDLATYQFLSANQEYLHSLLAWALTRRGELRMEVGFEFALVANQTPSQQAFDQALEDFQAAIQYQPRHWKAQLNLGVILGKRGQWDEAVESLQTSVESRPNQTHAYFNLAEIEAQRGNFSEALEWYDRVLGAVADDLQALNGRGLVLLRSGQGSEAATVFRRLLELRSQDPWIMTNLADALQLEGEWEEAEELYLAALREEQTPGIYRRLAWLYATCPDPRWQRPEGAMVVAKKAIAETKQRTAAYWDTLAAAQAASGRFDDALDSLKQAQQLQPESADFASRQELYRAEQPYLQTARLNSESSTNLK